MSLRDLLEISPRFSRSLNVERDRGVDAIDGYILTSRAQDVLGRVAAGISDARRGRAFSLTGPHGGGKSSLAVFLNALSSKRGSAASDAALRMLSEVDSELATSWRAALKSIDPKGKGAYAALVTADREPISGTIARAIRLAAPELDYPSGWTDSSRPVSGREVVTFLKKNLRDRWMILVVDEFGKNLEHFADDPDASDLFLLQSLAEGSQGESALPLVLITLQHLSFDEYVRDLAVSQRREWIKVQGRFQDIAYVESDVQSARLMSRAIHINNPNLLEAVEGWQKANTIALAELGFGDELRLGVSIAYPLHPTVQAILPTLCSRYGQNERTLFSFLAGPEPNALPALASRMEWDGEALRWVALSDVYDYFVASAATSISASHRASRFLEIEARIRDSAGLPAADLLTLKTIGLLNLVSAGGALRASREMLEFALVGVAPSSDTSEALDSSLERLSSSGLITYRDFADEFRVWQGSDFDLRREVENAQSGLDSATVSSLLNRFFPLQPIVAARHSQERGVFRVFARKFIEAADGATYEATPDDGIDGELLLVLGKGHPTLSVGEGSVAAQVACASVSYSNTFEAQVRESAALKAAVIAAEQSKADWVAQRELRERASMAEQIVQRQLDEMVSRISEIKHLNSGKTHSAKAGVSAGLSSVCDAAFSASPYVRNEVIARRQLSSQGSKARRSLLEAMINRPNVEMFGLEGYGPEVAIYEALFRHTGMHKQVDGRWQICRPSDELWAGIWDSLMDLISGTVRRRSVASIESQFGRAPYGVRQGVFSTIFVALISTHRDDVALFEHGTLVVKLDDAVLERLLRNPSFFSVKTLQVSSGARAEVFSAVCKRFKLKRADGGQPTLLAAMRSIYRKISEFPPTTMQTLRLQKETLLVRDAFARSAELDDLLFSELPQALGMDPVYPDSTLTERQVAKLVTGIADALKELSEDFGKIMADFERGLAEEFGVDCASLSELRSILSEQATELLESARDGDLKAVCPALMRQHIENDAWLENVALVATGGQPPRHWTDRERELAATELVRLGGAFRRARALAFSRSAGNSDGDSRLVTVTTPGGTEVMHVISAQSLEMSEARSKVQQLLKGARSAEKQALILAVLESLDGKGDNR